MPNTNEGSVAPLSESEQALAELQKEGHTLEVEKPQEIEKPEPTKEEPVEEPQKEEPKSEPTPKMVEAWKLHVAEDQKARLEEDLQDLKAKVEELSMQRTPITQEQKQEVTDDIKTMAEEAGVDAGFLTKFADTILKKAESRFKTSPDIEQTIQEYKDEKELNTQLTGYANEFENDVLPLVKEYNLSDTALSQLKNQLKEFAFSDTYAKVPLKEIFRIKEEQLDIQIPKRSSESKGVKTRANEVVDLENIDEDSFKRLSPEQIETFISRQTGGWSKPSGRI